jgi:hypothetical protein
MAIAAEIKQRKKFFLFALTLKKGLVLIAIAAIIDPPKDSS